ncbi:MAG TPA: MFS transporter [Solirubrobacteraceae bacterium]|nr:MFS transporter [Solirubrobacteraceae bacterium]
MLLAATNSGTLIIALPDLERSLHTSLLALVWVILAYLIAATVLVLMAGRLSDLFGRKRAYVGGFALFAFASLGAGFAGNGTELILWRILQGISSSFLFANAAALVTDAFPREQLGLAMGANTMVAAIGLVLGPVLGGALVAISWHWVFWFNVPLALAGAAWGAVVLRELAKPDEVRGYDVLGTTTFVIGFTGLVLGVSKGGISGWHNPVVIAGLAAAAVLLPLWIVIERRSRAPMLDLTLFRNRLFAAASAAAFINGLARFALMFLFVFYFQGAQGDSPIDAGIKLTPLALGMLVASPLAGVYADRHGSRALAAIGMVVTAMGLAGMTTLQVSSAYAESALWLALVGIGSGMFNSPNTAAMMGVVPAKRRGIAAAARTLLQNTGAVLSIAFVLAVVTSSIPKSTLFAVFSGLAKGLSPEKLAPFISNMHVALWALAGVSLLGAGVCLLRPSHESAAAQGFGAPATAAPPASAGPTGALAEGSQAAGL